MMRMKRVYEPPGPGDGKRFLVDRIWPRGVKKEGLRLDGWLPEVAPSAQLRQWFGHDPARWEEFVRRYHAELAATPEAWRPLLEAARVGEVTLLFAAQGRSAELPRALRYERALVYEDLGEPRRAHCELEKLYAEDPGKRGGVSI